MKNREKYRDEIFEALAELFNSGADGGSCGFMKKQVFPSYDLKKCAKKGTCGGVTCTDCAKMFAFWLDEEYTEPPKPEVDWNKVPVDTLVKVRDSQSEDWKLGFFKGFYPQNEFKFETWTNGETSKTGYDYEVWMYCELVEDEDDGSN